MKIAILGCGNMGLAFARSFIKYNLLNKNDLLLIEKDSLRKAQLQNANLGEVISDFDKGTFKNIDTLLICIKPQDFDTIKTKLKNALNPGITIITIMAGKTIGYLSQQLNHPFIVRAMPNTPSIVGMGIAAYTFHPSIDVVRVQKVEKILNSVGRSVFLEKEELMDAVTALSGSGPAYFYFIVKTMIDAGIQMGLEPHVASILVKQTFVGSFHLMNSKEADLDDLIKAVSSKGGTTEAALKYFSEHNFDKILISGIKQAEKRGKELAL